MKYTLGLALALVFVVSALPAFAQQQFGNPTVKHAEKKQAQQNYNKAQKKGAAASSNYTKGQAAKDGYSSMTPNEKAGYKKGFTTGK